MVWIELEDEEGAGWKGIAVDGYLPRRNELLKAYIKFEEYYSELVYGDENREGKKREGFIDARKLNNDRLFTAGFERGREIYSLKNKPIKCNYPCEIYHARIRKGKPILPPYSHFYHEFIVDPNSDSYRQIFIVQHGPERETSEFKRMAKGVKSGIDQREDTEHWSAHADMEGCPEMKACTLFSLNNLKFEFKPESAYKSYEKFKELTENFLEMIFDVYIAPCTMVEKEIKSFGMEC